MTTAWPLHRFTFHEYLKLESESPLKHEYWDGEILAMAGGTPEHARLAMAIALQIGQQLRNGCRVYSSDLRLRSEATGRAMYADGTVVCGPLELDPADKSGCTITNPNLIIEVTSPSTEQFDRGAKLETYKTIPSLHTIVIVSHREPRVDVVYSKAGDWIQVSATSGVAVLAGITIDVDALYQR